MKAGKREMGIRLSPKLFAVQLDDADKEGPENGKVFFSKPVDIAPGTWHSVVLEMVGDTMVGTLDDKMTGHGSDGIIRIIYDHKRTPDGEVLMAAFTEEDVRAGKSVSNKVQLRTLIDRLPQTNQPTDK